MDPARRPRRDARRRDGCGGAAGRGERCRAPARDRRLGARGSRFDPARGGAAQQRGLVARRIAALPGGARADLARRRDRRCGRVAARRRAKAIGAPGRAAGVRPRDVGRDHRARRERSRRCEQVAFGADGDVPGGAFRGGRRVDRRARRAPDRHPRRSVGGKGCGDPPLLDDCSGRDRGRRRHGEPAGVQRAADMGRAREHRIWPCRPRKTRPRRR